MLEMSEKALYFFKTYWMFMESLTAQWNPDVEIIVKGNNLYSRVDIFDPKLLLQYYSLLKESFPTS